jgi:hypothetical protein
MKKPSPSMATSSGLPVIAIGPCSMLRTRPMSRTKRMFARLFVGVGGGLVGFFQQHAVGLEASGRDVGEIVRGNVHPPLQNALRLQAEHECVIHRR